MFRMNMKILFLTTLIALSSCLSLEEEIDYLKDKINLGKQAVSAFFTWKDKEDTCSLFCNEIRNIQNIGECRTNCYAFEEHFLDKGEQLPLEAMLRDKDVYIKTFACYQEALMKSVDEPSELDEIFFRCLQEE